MGDTGGIRPNDARVRTDARGRVADEMLVEHGHRFERRLHQVTDDVWCLVGNGLSNQTFVRGPGGIVAIDTGESVEEMRAALAELRRVAADPVVAVIYTHFHYVGGTTAITETEPVGAIHGHARIAQNLDRSTTEIGPAYSRGIVEQFGVRLPLDGPDGNAGVGLGLLFHNPEHAPFTPGHVPVTHPFDTDCLIEVAGLEVHVHPAPSDADDSVTLWFPTLRVAVHNLVWPTLFNVFAIRGEEYRDPRVLVAGVDHLRSLGAEHLVAAHGPPMSGAEDIARRTMAYRDSVQYLWDQTVRWTNRGATGAELAHLVRLPDSFGDDWITQQHYGLVEHHVRQIRSGLFGFFDGDPANLLPLERDDHARRTIEAMGGTESVRRRCREVLAAGDEGDLRWALHLAAQLTARTDADELDRRLLADALRTVARRTTSANVRNWCLTRALAIEGRIDMGRHHTHAIGRRQAAAWGLDRTVAALRVMVDPDRLGTADVHVAFDIAGERVGIHFRNHIACPTDGVDADVTVAAERATWNDVIGGVTTLAERVRDGAARIDDPHGVGTERLLRVLSSLDHAGFALAAHGR